MDFITEALRQNPHWETTKVEFPRLSGPLVERQAYGELEASWRTKFITVLRGLRRTGKSVLARQLMKTVAERDPKKVAWFEFDRAMNATPEDLDSLIRFFQGRGAKTVILDEVAFVSHWQDILKRHYDRSDLKFVVTGSSAIELDQRTSESLAGRFQTIRVSPFTLKEKLAQKGKPFTGSALDEANRAEDFFLEAEEYIKSGGLPEIATAQQEARAGYINGTLLGPLFYKDLPAVFPEANPDMLSKTLEVLSGTVASTYQLQPIAEALGCSHPTAGTNVALLEKALLVRTAVNFTPSKAKQRRTAKKIVFADNGILTALRPDAGLGVLAENAALNVLGANYFWRSPLAEVDIVLPSAKVAAEVKYQEHITSSDERNLRYYLERRKGWRGCLVTKKDIDLSADIPRIPLWKILLQPELIAKP
ncbi:ATP-binding protein [Candidatus Micrarchaeota archaeon]|nr:ATP-binding protein [Candidatus Micrarchaeota archaeon]